MKALSITETGTVVARLLPSSSEQGQPLTFDKGRLNTAEEQIVEHIRANIRRGLPQIKLRKPQPNKEIAILGGGPSLLEHIDELRTFDGGIVSTNGALKWATGEGIKVHAHIQLDARDFNCRFVEPPVPGVKYLIASQAPPRVFDILKDEQTWIWHGGTAKLCLDDLEEVYGRGKYLVVKVGSTVLLGGMWVMWLLGYRKMHLYGFDSCLVEGLHHAYPQPENDKPPVIEVKLNGRLFHLHPWMWQQLTDFLQFSRFAGSHLDLAVHGDGLIAYALHQLAEHGELKLEEM